MSMGDNIRDRASRLERARERLQRAREKQMKRQARHGPRPDSSSSPALEPEPALSATATPPVRQPAVRLPFSRIGIAAFVFSMGAWALSLVAFLLWLLMGGLGPTPPTLDPNIGFPFVIFFLMLAGFCLLVSLGVAIAALLVGRNVRKLFAWLALGFSIFLLLCGIAWGITELLLSAG